MGGRPFMVVGQLWVGLHPTVDSRGRGAKRGSPMGVEVPWVVVVVVGIRG